VFKVTAKRARQHTTLSASFPEKPGSRKAGKPESRKAETREAGEPKRPRCRLCLGRSDETSCAFTPYYRYATMPYGMPRHRGHVHSGGNKNISRSLLIIFQSKLRVCLTPSRVSHHRNCCGVGEVREHLIRF
jgi:hypothetical protein